MKYVAPSVRETAFNCPHCGALAKQFWYTVRADTKTDDNPLPRIITEADDEDWSHIQYKEIREDMIKWTNRLKTGVPFFTAGNNGNHSYQDLNNFHVSKCYNCDDTALWIHDRLIYPQRGEGPPPNPDLPDDILQDYREASAILDLSPRGAAALMRLCIQKLCKHLGQPGENINADIKALVADGLDVRIQKALDAVRVIGNNAVHPGALDISDDRATAESLFRLLNIIVEKMISESRHVDEVYSKLPPGALEQIAKRDKEKKANE